MKLDVFGSYLQSQAALPETAREPQPLAITISREVGSGGRTIAELLGQRLTAAEKTPATSPWAVFDANLAKHVLEDHKLPPNLERFMTEDARLLQLRRSWKKSWGFIRRAGRWCNTRPKPSFDWLA